jgi:hypothetical protein
LRVMGAAMKEVPWRCAGQADCTLHENIVERCHDVLYCFAIARVGLMLDSAKVLSLGAKVCFQRRFGGGKQGKVLESVDGKIQYNKLTSRIEKKGGWEDYGRAPSSRKTQLKDSLGFADPLLEVCEQPGPLIMGIHVELRSMETGCLHLGVLANISSWKACSSLYRESRSHPFVYRSTSNNKQGSD